MKFRAVRRIKSSNFELHLEGPTHSLKTDELVMFKTFSPDSP